VRGVGFHDVADRQLALGTTELDSPLVNCRGVEYREPTVSALEDGTVGLRLPGERRGVAAVGQREEVVRAQLVLFGTTHSQGGVVRS
jgi:hypothetical protein